MIFKKMTVGPLDTDSYIIGSEKTKEIALIDPGFEPKRIIDGLRKKHKKKKKERCPLII